ncbi:MAG: hypothetical protein QGH50_17530 [SAR324 cluster bacterium]|nr:hypothetical protein [SAR324 cluster bacterium]
MGEGLVRPWGPYPGASNSCISISPGFLGIEGRPLGGGQMVKGLSNHA